MTTSPPTMIPAIQKKRFNMAVYSRGKTWGKATLKTPCQNYSAPTRFRLI